VLEYGIDAPGDMDYLTSIVKPDYGIFTKLDFVHAQFFNNKEEI
jgi:UDP-N-acetylmuramyl pentapeptide synthase